MGFVTSEELQKIKREFVDCWTKTEFSLKVFFNGEKYLDEQIALDDLSFSKETCKDVLPASPLTGKYVLDSPWFRGLLLRRWTKKETNLSLFKTPIWKIFTISYLVGLSIPNRTRESIKKRCGKRTFSASPQSQDISWALTAPRRPRALMQAVNISCSIELREKGCFHLVSTYVKRQDLKLNT